MLARKIRTAAFLLLMSLFFCSPGQAAPICSKNGELSKRFNLPIYEWSDPDKLSRGTIVALHGLTFYAAAYDDLASYLAERGYRFIALDIRGFGRWRQESSKFDGDDQIHFTQTYDDTLKIAQALRKDDPEQKMFIMGESLGANMALDLASKNSDLWNGAILGSPCYKAKIHPHPKWILDLCKGLRNPNARLNLTPYITPHLSHDKNLTRECLKDPRICRQLSPVELIKAQKTNQWALLNVDKLPPEFPILVIAGEKDGVFKTKTLPELFQRFGTKQLDVNVFPDLGHLLLEHQSVNPRIASIFERWLGKQTDAERVAVQLTK